MSEETKIVTVKSGRWSSKEPNITSLPREAFTPCELPAGLKEIQSQSRLNRSKPQLCNHQHFKRTMVINRKDGTTDWKGKCEDCQKIITLKKVYFKSYKTETGDCGATQTLKVSARPLS